MKVDAEAKVSITLFIAKVKSMHHEKNSLGYWLDLQINTASHFVVLIGAAVKKLKPQVVHMNILAC